MLGARQPGFCYVWGIMLPNRGQTEKVLRNAGVSLMGELDPNLSRWLWLVKWLLAIPHFVILFFLRIGFLVSTIIAFFIILFTGRYPPGLFNFNVGVLRWHWRVAFYCESVLGTDRYPPFTLKPADYPATLEIEYPERLSRGLVLVKWWLLAIPHYLILAVLQGGSAPRFGGLNAVLVMIAVIWLLFTGRYNQDIPIGSGDLPVVHVVNRLRLADDRPIPALPIRRMSFRGMSACSRVGVRPYAPVLVGRSTKLNHPDAA